MSRGCKAEGRRALEDDCSGEGESEHLETSEAISWAVCLGGDGTETVRFWLKAVYGRVAFVPRRQLRHYFMIRAIRFETWIASRSWLAV